MDLAVRILVIDSADAPRPERLLIMPTDIRRILSDYQETKYTLHERHLNHQLVKVLRTLGSDINFVRGRGAYLYDTEGREYLDLLSGWGVFAIGRNHPGVAAALAETMAAELPGMVQMDVSALSAALAERLTARIPFTDKAVFCNSGAEAVETAIKFARAATGRPGILYCEHGFHGLTTGALSLNGEAIFRDRFGELLPACRAVPFNDLAALESALAGNDVAAFVVEPVQGKTVEIAAPGYLAEAARLCRRHGTLFIADEIQTGVGRTGRFLALEHWGVEADMVLLAKALSGGFMPVAAVMMRRPIFDAVYDRMERAMVHGSTFSKNDLAMAAGIATLDVLDDEGLIANAASRGEALMAALRPLAARHDVIKDVRGLGLMIGVEFGRPSSLRQRATWSMVETANVGLFCQLVLVPLLRDHRILCQVAGYQSRVIKLLPPLTIDEGDLHWIVGALEETISGSLRAGAVWDLGRTLAGHARHQQQPAET